MALSTLLKPTSSRFLGTWNWSFSRANVTVDVRNNVKIKKDKFHTTASRHISPKVVLLVGSFSPLTLIGAPLFGLCCKRWWTRRTPEEKQIYKGWFTAGKPMIYGALGFLLASLCFFCVTHTERNSVTGRFRFLGFTEEQQKHYAKLSYEARSLVHQNSTVHAGHPAYLRIRRILDRIIEANRDDPLISEKHWTLTVVASDSSNVMILPGGNIFVALEALRVFENDDQLAAIMAHEISHVLLQHPIEYVSMDILLGILLTVPIATVWTKFSVLVAIVLEVLAIGLAYVLVTLPQSRKLEAEADNVGMKLAAKACFDVREAVVFWKIMKMLADLGIQPKCLPWLSTHPHSEDRDRELNAKLDEAIALRAKCGCPTLSSHDPIASFNARTPEQHAHHFKARGILQ